MRKGDEMDASGCGFGVVSMVAVPPRASANVPLESFVTLPPAFDDVASQLPVRAGTPPRCRGGCLVVAPEIDMSRD